MNTSYYFSKLLTNNMNLVAISNSVPKHLSSLRSYSSLIPPWHIVKDLKDNLITEKGFTTLYYGYILNNIDPIEVVRDLGENAILLCWEKPGEFCHRRCVAEWLKRELGMEVLELTENKPKSLWDKNNEINS